MPSELGGISIGELAAATGVAAGTLRMWEVRHGFPVARRGTGGHRRYDSEDVARVARVLEERERGLSLAAAIERVREWAPSAPPSLFATVRSRQPELPSHHLPVRGMLAISRAIEDECLATAAQPILAGSFQSERAFRRSEARWRELARTATLAFVLADFRRARTPRGGPAEVPLDARSHVRREWAVVCVDARLCACLAGWEQPANGGRRRFEAIWSTDPATAVAALEVALAVAGPPLSDRGAEALAGLTRPLGGGVAATLAVGNRAIGYLAG